MSIGVQSMPALQYVEVATHAVQAMAHAVAAVWHSLEMQSFTPWLCLIWAH